MVSIPYRQARNYITNFHPFFPPFEVSIPYRQARNKEIAEYETLTENRFNSLQVGSQLLGQFVLLLSNMGFNSLQVGSQPCSTNSILISSNSVSIPYRQARNALTYGSLKKLLRSFNSLQVGSQPVQFVSLASSILVSIPYRQARNEIFSFRASFF